MEILTFLGLTPKRLVGLGALSALTASGAAVLATRQPATYSATATVFVGQALPDDANVFDLPPLVADFQTVATWKPIVDGAAASAQVQPGDLTVTTKRNGDGSAVQLTVVAPTAESAQTGATEIALGGMTELTRRATLRAGRVEAEKTEELTRAREQVERLDTANGYIDPGATYADVQEEATRLDLVAQDPAAQLNEAQRSAYLVQAAKLRGELPDLATKKETYRVAREALVQAETELREAVEASADAKALQATASDPAVVSVDAPVAGSSLPAMVRAGGAAALVTGIAGVGLISALDRRKRTAAHAEVVASLGSAPKPPQQDPAVAATTPTSPAKPAPSSAEESPKAAATSAVAAPVAVKEKEPTEAPSSADSNGTKKPAEIKPAANASPTKAHPTAPSTPKSPAADKSTKGNDLKTGPADKDNGRTVGLFQGRDRSEGTARERSR